MAGRQRYDHLVTLGPAHASPIRSLVRVGERSPTYQPIRRTGRWRRRTTTRPGLRPPERGICRSRISATPRCRISTSCAALQRLEFEQPNRAPVMAEIDLVSSHTPWAPLPPARRLEPGRRRLGFEPDAGRGRVAGGGRRDPDLVKAAYAESVAYSLDAVTSFVQQLHDQDLVLVVLGDHQPGEHRLRSGGEPRRAGEHHRRRPGGYGSGGGLGLAEGAAAGRRRTGVADGRLPGQVPHRVGPRRPRSRPRRITERVRESAAPRGRYPVGGSLSTDGPTIRSLRSQSQASCSRTAGRVLPAPAPPRSRRVRPFQPP